ncbi:MAG TPA: F0F1 ATP synthase subunit A [Polyangiaceae bacterium]|nr:F0F1 ATP synthase subunit A [Polyangiaceae bacterium]
MPSHSTWLTFILGSMKDNLDANVEAIGNSLMNGHPPTWMSFEPIVAAMFVAFIVLVLALLARARLVKLDEAVIPDDKLSLRTFMEVFLGYFYDLAKSMMGPKRAKKYFPVIGTSAIFVFFANVMALIPGMPVATSNLNITLGCAIVVFVLFNFYGLKENGWSYIKHLAGPAWYLAPLVFVIEVISLCVRPITLAVRLMLNMSVDHLILSIFVSLVALVIPVPLMILGCLIVLIQTLVFTLLTTIYISLATEHDHH